METHDEYCVAHATLVSVPSSATMITRDGEFSPRVSPVQGGGTRAFVPSVRSESAGGAIRSPEGGPPRRSGKTWEHGDVGGGSYVSSTVLSSRSRKWGPRCDEGANFTQHNKFY